MIYKLSPIRSKKYKAWVVSLNCCNCGAPADDPHHAIGVGESGAGMTACDLLIMPMCRGCHTWIHNTPEAWPNQWMWISKTLQRAVKEGIVLSLPELAVSKSLF